MNPLLNPLISLPILKDYLFDPSRLNRLNHKQLEKYRDKALRKIVNYAYMVPMYHKKYKKVGVHPTDIKGIADIEKLPFITKEDIVNNFPDKIIPFGYDKKRNFVVGTGGTTGKPVSIYVDFYIMSKAAITTIRELNYFKMPWRKTKLVHLGNFNKYRVDLVYQEHFQSHVERLISMKGAHNIDVDLPIKDMIGKLGEIQPDIIMSYPAVFQHLAFMKRKGYGKKIKPKLLWTGGAMLDEYTRSYVEDAFGCRLLNIYPTVEAGAHIAFECEKGNWHVNSDLFQLEAIDEKGDLVEEGKRGHVVLTRLWGKGTPIIRYTGMDDWIRLSHDEECSCGINTTIIINGVEGRKRANIVLPNGKVFPPGAFCFINPVLHELKTYKVKQYQIVQRKINEIEILLVIDEDLREIGASVETISRKIKKLYEKKTGPEVSIVVKEVHNIKNSDGSSKPPPIVVSHVKMDEGYALLESKN